MMSFEVSQLDVLRAFQDEIVEFKKECFDFSFHTAHIQTNVSFIRLHI